LRNFGPTVFTVGETPVPGFPDLNVVSKHTLFTDQYAAYETLPTHVRDRLRGRTITHIVTGLELNSKQETQAVHPVFLVHPRSGRTALYMSTPQRCAAMSGMPSDEAAQTISYLFRHATRDDNIYRHAWSEGDVVMWDNRCVLHRADHSGVIGDRVLHRGMVADQGSFDSAVNTK
jgi:taurine dioxygenase